ncbi:MAG TPA: hypothetical protein VIQ53_07985, partial [Inquilinus sp.]
AQLRERARAWLRSVHEGFGLTTILVTHDQSEALSMSDQVVLLSRGSVEQVGTAAEVYERPRTAHVAEFVGGANLIQGRIGASGTGVMTNAGIAVAARTTSTLAEGTPICVAIRPQKIRLLAPGGAAEAPGTVLPFAPRTVLYQGSSFEITGSTPLGDLRVLADRAPPAQDARVLLPAEDCLCVNP